MFRKTFKMSVKEIRMKKKIFLGRLIFLFDAWVVKIQVNEKDKKKLNKENGTEKRMQVEKLLEKKETSRTSWDKEMYCIYVKQTK